ncbi:hypothetical protein TNCV_4269201 [Trichonephila clavipes]|nr:hypothetical protein TNCV_4269201 [Trichonephila clavipes]
MQISRKEQDSSLEALKIYCRKTVPEIQDTQQNLPKKSQNFTPLKALRHNNEFLKYKAERHNPNLPQSLSHGEGSLLFISRMDFYLPIPALEI